MEFIFLIFSGQVVDTAVQSKPEPKNTNTHIVKSDWFWYTIQNGYADELDYLFENVRIPKHHLTNIA